MQVLIPALLLLCVGLTAAQKIIPLNRIFTEFTAILDVEVGSSLYLTSHDMMIQLKNITITCGNDVYNAYDLANSGVAQKPKRVLNANTVVIRTKNIDAVTNFMNGFIYIATAAQTQDPNFLVYDVIQPVDIDRSKYQQSTLVFLNIVLEQQTPNSNIYKPFRTSYVTGIQQDDLPTTELNLYRGVPSVDWKDKDKSKTYRIFTNPIYIPEPQQPTDRYFFKNIEPLQMRMEAWYLVADGGIKLSLDSKWVSPTVYNTTAVTTTGLIMTEDFSQNLTVNFLLTQGNNRTVGTLNTIDLNLAGVSGSILDIVYHSVNGGQFIQGYASGTLNNLLASSDIVATQLTVTSPNIYIGKYYIQYFGIDGISMPTTPGTTAPSTISTKKADNSATTMKPAETSTKSANTVTGTPGTTAPSTISTKKADNSATTMKPVQTSTKSANTVTVFFTVLAAMISFIF